MNLTGYVQCILCVDSLVDILVHQSGTFFVLWYFDCCIDCIVFGLSVCLSVSTQCCVNKDYQNTPNSKHVEKHGGNRPTGLLD